MQTEMKAVYLSGGGDEKQSFPLDEAFVNDIPQGGRILYIPIALRNHSKYENAPKWFSALLLSHGRGDIHVDVCTDLVGKKADDVMSYHAIYIGGGNTWSLMKELRDAHFDIALAEYRKVGILYGGSAGAIITGKRIDTQRDSNTVQWVETNGMGYVYDYSIACHFKDTQIEMYKDWVCANNLPLICLSEESGILVNQDTAQSIGSTVSVIHPQSQEVRVFEPEDTFSLNSLQI